jgi:ubiquinone biosynthesis protein UbiJ
MTTQPIHVTRAVTEEESMMLDIVRLLGDLLAFDYSYQVTSYKDHSVVDLCGNNLGKEWFLIPNDGSMQQCLNELQAIKDGLEGGK